MRNVLIALKERNEAPRLAAVAGALFEPGTEIDVAHVLEAGSGSAFAEADDAVEAAVDMLRARAFVARGHVDAMGERGIAGRLAERARTSDAELVVMGSRGFGHAGSLVGRSVSHALLASLDVPVLVLPDEAPPPLDGFRRVLAAVGSEGDVRAVVAAVRLLPGPVEVLAVHVPRRVAVHAGEGVPATFLELGETSDAVLAEAHRRLRVAGFRFTTRELERDGGVAEAICDMAREWDADVIVVGPRRPRAWKAFIAGSTSYGVLHHGDRPVLIAGR